jgi:hypothetical protein
VDHAADAVAGLRPTEEGRLSSVRRVPLEALQLLDELETEPAPYGGSRWRPRPATYRGAGRVVLAYCCSNQAFRLATARAACENSSDVIRLSVLSVSTSTSQ